MTDTTIMMAMRWIVDTDLQFVQDYQDRDDGDDVVCAKMIMMMTMVMVIVPR